MVENALNGKAPDAKVLADAAAQAASGIDPLSDVHASADFRTELVRVYSAARRRARSRAPRADLRGLRRPDFRFDMKITGEQTLPAPRDRVWALFNDPERLSRLIPGCEKLEVISPTEFAGTLNVGIAAVKGVYAGKLKLDEVRPSEHYKMAVDGKGKQGFMRGSGTLDFAAKDANETVVTYGGDIQIGGPLIQVGQRVIDSAAKMMIGQFFAAADAELKAEAAGAVARQGFFLNFWRYLMRLVRSLFTRA